MHAYVRVWYFGMSINCFIKKLLKFKLKIRVYIYIYIERERERLISIGKKTCLGEINRMI